MYRFENGILYASKLPTKWEFNGYPVSDHRVAYEHYLYDEPDEKQLRSTLKGDLRNLADMISDRVTDSTGVKTQISIKISSIIENDSNAPEFSHGTYQTTVIGNFYKDDVKMYGRDFPLVRLPYVDRFGIITKRYEHYSIAATSEPSRFITLDGNKLNIMLQAVKMCLETKQDKVMTVIAQQKVSLTTLIYYVFMHMRDIFEMPSEYSKFSIIDNVYTRDLPNIADELLGIVDSNSVIWQYKNKDKMEFFEIYGDNPSAVNTLDNYKAESLGMFGLIKHGHTRVSKYDAASVRYELNELLSLDRGLDRKLSRPIYDSEGMMLYEVGDIVTREVLEDLNEYHINRYYVQCATAMVEGAKLAFNVGITHIKAGTLIPQELLTVNSGLHIHCNRYGVISSDYEFDFGHLFVIPENTEVDSTMIGFISSVDLYPYHIDYIQGKDHLTTTKSDKEIQMSKKAIAVKLNSSKKYSLSNIKYIMLEEEIVGNQHFLVDGEWKYVSRTTGEIAEPAPTLTVYDLIALKSILPRIYMRSYLNKVSDRDFGMRKRICLIDDHLHKSFEKMRSNMMKSPVTLFKQLDKVMNENASDSGKVLTQKEKFCNTFSMWWIDKQLYSTRDMKVINLADKVCPPAYVSSINRVNTIVKSKHGASQKMRFLAAGFYGRICPYETPASGKLGLVNTKAVHAVAKDGYIYTEYYKVRNGKIDFSKKIPMIPSEEEQYIIADITSLDFTEDGTITNTGDLILARVPVFNAIEKHIVENVPVSSIQYVNCYPDQTLSPTATTIPFIGSDDAVRVSYGLSMCKQTRGLLHREVPTVMTKAFYDMIRYNTMFQIVAEDDGYIEEITQQQKHSSKRAGEITITVRYDNVVDNGYDGVNEEAKFMQEYKFAAVEYSYSSVIVRYVECRVGQRIKKGDVLVSSNYTKDGYMATGVDALVAIIPVGYNYEDGVQISEAFEEKLTSYGHSNTELQLSTSQGVPKQTYIRYIESNDMTVLTVKPKTKLDENGKPVQRQKDKAFKTDDLRGWIVHTGVSEKRRGKDTYKVRIDAVSINNTTEGDKIANRHGNKGVMPKIAKNTDMLYLENGELIDLAYNPAGIGSRMNLGQIKEIHMGLACRVIGIKLGLESFNELPWHEIRKLLTYAYECANYGVDKANSNPKFSDYPEEMKQHVKRNEKQIARWAGVFDEYGRAYLINPKTGKRTRHPVVIGYVYVYKLVQEIEEKIHARGSYLSDVPYVVKYAQPTRGAGNNGGQSYGYMETAGLIAHGATNFLYELQHNRGDDIYARQVEMMELLGTYNDLDDGDKMLGKMDEFKERRSLEYFKAVLTALGLSFEVDDEDETEELHDTRDYKPGDKFFFSDRFALNGSKIKTGVAEKVTKEYTAGILADAAAIGDDDD